MATKTFPISACMPVIYSGGSGMNPGDLHLPIGEWAPGLTGWNTRALLKASISFAGMTAINEARLYVYGHTAASWHAKGSGSVSVEARRKTADWSEASGGSSTATDEIYGGSSGTLVSSAYADDGDGNGAINNGAADSTLDYLPITLMARKWLGGAANYGVLLYAVGSASTDACELYSRRASGKVPYIWIDYETNTPPNAPTDLSPTANEVVNTGRTITYSGTRSDPDSGDYISAFEFQVWNDGHTVLLQTYLDDDLSGTVTAWSRAVTLPPGYLADRFYDWRARTRDKAGAWGPWSAYQGFRPNTVPTTPAAPTVEGDSLTPVISGSVSDPDAGDSTNGVAVEVWPMSGAELWHPSTFAQAGNGPYSITYAGPPLAWGTKYRVRVRARDTFSAFSAYSAWREFTPTQPIGPDNLTPRTTATKQQTLTPTLTVGHSAAFTNDEIEVYPSNSATGTKLWTKAAAGTDYAAATSKPYPYAGTALQWGGTYYWRARVKIAGTFSSWSPLVPFYVNAEPLAPSELAARSSATSPPVVNGGVNVVTTTTPLLEAVFGDPDLAAYADRPSSRTVEIYVRNADGSAGASKHTNTLASPPYAVPMTYAVPAGAALAAGNDYLVRWRFVDNANRQSPYSAYMTLRVTTAPVVAVTSPPNASTITDSTPLLDWSFTGAGGKPQAAFQVRLFETGAAGVPYPDGEIQVHDSGVLSGSATAYQVPANVVLDERSYRWQVDAWDSDGLLGSLV